MLTLSAATIGAVSELPILVIAFGCFGCSLVIWSVLFRSYQQRNIPKYLQGRYFSNTNAATTLIMPLGFLLTGVSLK